MGRFAAQRGVYSSVSCLAYIFLFYFILFYFLLCCFFFFLSSFHYINERFLDALDKRPVSRGVDDASAGGVCTWLPRVGTCLHVYMSTCPSVGVSRPSSEMNY